MGTSRSGLELANKLDRAAAKQSNVSRDGSKAGAKLVKDAVLVLMAQASGGDLVLNRVGDGKGARIGVTTKPVANGVLVKATGPAQLVENRLRPHLEGPRGVGVRKGRRSRAGRLKAVDSGTAVYGPGDVLHFGDVFARYVAHPGVPVNKHPWEKGTKAAAPKVPAAFQKAEHAALLEVFR